MDKYKTMNLIKKIIVFPIKLLFFPFFLFAEIFGVIVGFLVVDWENDVDRHFYIKEPLEDIGNYWK